MLTRTQRFTQARTHLSTPSSPTPRGASPLVPHTTWPPLRPCMPPPTQQAATPSAIADGVAASAIACWMREVFSHRAMPQGDQAPCTANTSPCPVPLSILLPTGSLSSLPSLPSLPALGAGPTPLGPAQPSASAVEAAQRCASPLSSWNALLLERDLRAATSAKQDSGRAAILARTLLPSDLLRFAHVSTVPPPQQLPPLARVQDDGDHAACLPAAAPQPPVPTFGATCSAAWLASQSLGSAPAELDAVLSSFQL